MRLGQHASILVKESNLLIPMEMTDQHHTASMSYLILPVLW
jgi:hypothetical protein